MITVSLNQNAEARLRSDAQAKGITTEEYAQELLEGALTRSTTVGQQILDELKQEGVLGAWRDRPDSQDAQAYARELRDNVWTRSRED